MVDSACIGQRTKPSSVGAIPSESLRQWQVARAISRGVPESPEMVPMESREQRSLCAGVGGTEVGGRNRGTDALGAGLGEFNSTAHRYGMIV